MTHDRDVYKVHSPSLAAVRPGATSDFANKVMLAMSAPSELPELSSGNISELSKAERALTTTGELPLQCESEGVARDLLRHAL